MLDEKILSKIGIAADDWDWYTGEAVKDQKYLYPTIPDTYTYLDPPYEVNGHPVRSGPGWVVMSARDLARFGLLVATGGNWKGEQLIAPGWGSGPTPVETTAGSTARADTTQPLAGSPPRESTCDSQRTGRVSFPKTSSWAR